MEGDDDTPLKRGRGRLVTRILPHPMSASFYTLAVDVKVEATDTRLGAQRDDKVRTTVPEQLTRKEGESVRQEGESVGHRVSVKPARGPTDKSEGTNVTDAVNAVDSTTAKLHAVPFGNSKR